MGEYFPETKLQIIKNEGINVRNSDKNVKSIFHEKSKKTRNYSNENLTYFAVSILIYITLPMKPMLIAGIIIVNLALISYSIAIISEQRKKLVNTFVLIFLTIGVILDISATVCMILGSANSFATLHGLLGYSALAVMLIDAALLWKLWMIKKKSASVSQRLHLYSRYAFIWWVMAYITGALIVALS